ncbi:hypothetical protein AAFH68_16620 [Flavobacterium sp. CGRL1]
MDIIIKRPFELSEKEIYQIIDLIESGSQIQGIRETINRRLRNAVLISFILDNDKIVATATLKNPAETYQKKVFKEAESDADITTYKYELGYIVTASSREGEKLCQKLLAVFFPKIAAYKMFATTRKAEMVHILGKYGFSRTGIIYNLNLCLLVN